MPTIFVNGTQNQDGYYSGALFSTDQQLLILLRDNLAAAGWTVNDTTMASNNYITARGVDGTHNCWIRFEVVTGSGNTRQLVLRGDFDGTGSSLSPANSVTNLYDLSATPRLYLAADSAGGCVGIATNVTMESSHFGFLERTTNDPNAWMLGKLDVYLANSYLAQDYHGARWKHMVLYWRSTAAESSNNPAGAYQLIWDRFTTAFMGDAYSSASTNGTDFEYGAYKGSFDAVTGLPLLGNYGYIVGQNAHNAYYPTNVNTVSEVRKPMHFPGWVRFARVGLASAEFANQYVVGSERVISGGAATLYQGFRIA